MKVPVNGQRTLAFAHAWEVESSGESRACECAQHARERRAEQRMALLAAGLSDVADAVRVLHEQSEHVASALSRVEGAVGAVGRLQQQLEHVATALSRIEGAVKQRSLLDDEVRRYRNDELRSEIHAPFLAAVIAILDRYLEEDGQIRRFEAELKASPNALAAMALAWVRDARELDKTELRNLLTRWGVEWFRSQPGDAFDPTRHKPIALVPTDLPRLHRRIANTRRYGYLRRNDNWLIRLEWVTVHHLNS